MKLIDSHCHLDFPEFSDVDQLLTLCQQQSIQNLIIPSTEPQSWPRVESICDQHNTCYWAAGLHPWWVNQERFKQLQRKLEQALSSPQCIAVGECGLDGARGIEDIHLKALTWQLARAADSDTPVIIHAHKAHNELLPLLKQFPTLRGVIHGFHGSLELAHSYTRLGFYIGVGGGISYPRAKKTREMVSKLELDHIILETDAPSMPLHGQQGRYNSPLALTTIAHCLANLKGLSIETIANACTENTEKLFKLNLCNNHL